MAKSRKRDGQKKHNKRISERKNVLNAKQSAVQKLFEESMRAQIEEMKKKSELESESGVTTNV